LVFYPSANLVLTGTLTWVNDYGDDSETMTMNLVLLDGDTGKTYWFDNYQVETTNYENGITQVIEGRYYDYDYGYVDVSTPESIFTYYYDSWPSDGVFLCEGSNGTWARLVFGVDITWLQVDINGNGTVDVEVDVTP
jgi:hypothetical protein